MATQKRRIVYMSDDEWAGVRETSQRLGYSTISAYLRAVILGGVADDQPINLTAAPRDPFTTFRPAPKPGRK